MRAGETARERFANNSRVKKGAPADCAPRLEAGRLQPPAERVAKAVRALLLTIVMRYRVTRDTQVLLTEVVLLVRDTRRGLGGVSVAAIEEWDEMRLRFPTDDDAREGFISLCEMDLLRLRMDLRRFREKAWGPGVMGPVETDTRQAL